MNEIGGYIEFEHYYGPMLHEDGILLNCGRSCLAYLIEAKNITKIAIPFYLCESIQGLCKKYSVELDYYHVDRFMKPDYEKDCPERWVYIVNYYGQLSTEDIKAYKKHYSSIIIDNSQAYFEKPVANVDTLYSCRKYFGVSDGGILYSDAVLDKELEWDSSSERMHFLLGRFEHCASDYYEEYVSNNVSFNAASIKRMSKLTANLLHGVDYSRAERVRRQNFAFLHDRLSKINLLPLQNEKESFMYPLMIKNGHKIREKLIKRKIYVPTLWPELIDHCPKDCLEQTYVKDILPLPIDQRYTIEDMEYMCEVFFDCYDEIRK